jgi:hypothetical protein
LTNAHAALAAFALLALLVGAGCRRDKAQRVAGTSLSGAGLQPSSSAFASDPDASVADLDLDPPARAGSLAKDLEAFESVARCVETRAEIDPLLGDGLSNLGYDTFVHDACISLEAAKAKRTDLCHGVSASALRKGCERLVAVTARDPDACPRLADANAQAGREQECVAVALRDARFCAAVPSLNERAHCLALASALPAQCSGLAPGARRRCERDLARMDSLLRPVVQEPAFPVVSAVLRIGNAEGEEGAKQASNTLARIAERGVVLVVYPSYVEFQIGFELYEAQGSVASGPTQLPHFSARVRVAKDARASLERLELDVPGHATYLAPPSYAKCNVTAQVDKLSDKPLRGASVQVALNGVVGVPPQQFKIALSLTSYVRDVVLAPVAP